MFDLGRAQATNHTACIQLTINLVDWPSRSRPSFEHLYVFGDSLSDNGNEFAGLNYIQANLDPHIEIDAPSPPYFPGRESNGLVWSEYLAEDLGLTLTPVAQLEDDPLIVENADGAYEVVASFGGRTATQSTNFAFSGARLASDDIDPGDLATPSVSTQVDWFLDDLAVQQQSASDDALYVIQGGGNDYISGDFADPTEPVTSISESIVELYDAGARYFLVPNLADLGSTPIGQDLTPEESAFLTDVSNRHNDLLGTTLSKLERDLPGIRIESPDFRALTLDVANDPEAFGLTNGTDAYLVGEPPSLPTTGDNPDDYFYWDYIHPTTAGQSLLADVAFEGARNLAPTRCGQGLIEEVLHSILRSTCSQRSAGYDGMGPLAISDVWQMSDRPPFSISLATESMAG